MKAVNKFSAVVLGVSLLALSGCGSPGPTAGERPSDAKLQIGSSAGIPSPGSKEGEGRITQEELEIKVRVDSPSYNHFLRWAEPGPVIPGLNQNLIPQGIGYVPELDWLIVSNYRKDGKPSVLAVIRSSDGKLVKSVELYRDEKTPYQGHAGGVTVSAKHVWVASDKSVYQVPIEALEEAEDGGKLVFTNMIDTETNASFNNYSNGILWVGEFARFNYKTDETHHMENRQQQKYSAWVAGYVLNDQDEIDPGKRMEDSKKAVPDYILSIPEEIQGMEWIGDRVILSQSYGRNNESSLQAYRWTLEEEPHQYTDKFGEPVPVWFLDADNREGVLKMPPMSEGIVEKDGKLFILFESGAAEYRSGFYPLDRIYELKISEWLSSSD